MCSRGVWQLQKLVLRYHWQRGASQGVRDFIGKDALDFARANSQIKIETLPTKGTPTVTAEYLNGYANVRNLGNKDAAEVSKVLRELRDQTGQGRRRYKRDVYQSRTSVQGVWDPSTTFGEFSLKV